MIDFPAPMEGMRRAEDRLGVAAERIARTPATGSGPAAGDTVDLSAEMIALMEARNQFAANLKAFAVGDRMARTALDVLG